MSFESSARVVAELETLVSGLLFVSEADYPLVVTRLGRLEEREPLDERALLRALSRDADLQVEVRSVADFFARAVEDQPWHGPTERAAVERYRALVRFLVSELADTRVFRIGAIDVDVYALGRAPDGEWLGVATKVIET